MSTRVGECPNCGQKKVLLIGTPNCMACKRNWVSREDWKIALGRQREKEREYFGTDFRKELQELIRAAKLEVYEHLIEKVESVLPAEKLNEFEKVYVTKHRAYSDILKWLKEEQQRDTQAEQ